MYIQKLLSGNSSTYSEMINGLKSFSAWGSVTINLQNFNLDTNQTKYSSSVIHIWVLSVDLSICICKLVLSPSQNSALTY